MYEERLSQLQLRSLEKRLQGDLTAICHYLMRRCGEDGALPGACTATRQEAADTSCDMGHMHQILGKNFHHEGGQTQGAGICVISVARDKQNMPGQGWEQPDLNSALL